MEDIGKTTVVLEEANVAQFDEAEKPDVEEVKKLEVEQRKQLAKGERKKKDLQDSKTEDIKSIKKPKAISRFLSAKSMNCRCRPSAVREALDKVWPTIDEHT